MIEPTTLSSLLAMSADHGWAFFILDYIRTHMRAKKSCLLEQRILSANAYSHSGTQLLSVRGSK